MIGKRYSEKKPWWQISALVFALSLTGNVFAQDDADAEEGDEAVELDRVIVTGSRIERTEIEGPAPVVVITAEQIELEGFTTINEALQTLTQNSNFGQTEADGGTFTGS